MIDLTLKVTALLGAAWVVATMLRGRAASTRHAVWIGLMAAALALPVFAAVSPRVELAWLPADPPGISQPHQASGRTVDTLPQGLVEPFAPGESSSQSSAASSASLTAPTLRQALLAGWFVVALFLVLRLVAAHVQARRALAACSAPSDALAGALAPVARELGMSAPPLRIARAGTMPAVIGVLRPSIVLPLEASSWTADRLRVVLLHECAHVRRRDAMLQVVANVAAAAYWWHPLAWIAARRVARERELACDDLVIATGTTGAQYAEHLLEIARSLRPSRQPALAALAMARTSELEGRLIALLEDRPRPTRPARALALGVALALAAVSIAPLKIVAQDGAPVTMPARATATATATAPALETPAHAHAPAEALAARGDAPRPRAMEQTTAAPASEQTMQDVLMKAVTDEDQDVRTLAIAAVGRSTSPEAVAIVVRALSDPSDDVRTIALAAFARMEHPDKAALLLKAASDPSEDVRTMAALGLGRVSGTAVDEMLVRLAGDVSADVRRAAIIAITRRAGDDLDIEKQFGGGIAEAVASGIAQGVVGGIAGALDARLGPPRKQ